MVPPKTATSPFPSLLLRVPVTDAARVSLCLPPLRFHNGGAPHIHLDPQLLLPDDVLLGPLNTLIPNHDNHYPMDPLNPLKRLTPTTIVRATVLHTDVVAIQQTGLTETVARRQAIACALGMTEYDTNAEKSWQHQQDALWTELGVEIPNADHQNAHPLRRCSCCLELQKKLYTVRLFDGPAAEQLLQRAAVVRTNEILEVPEKCGCGSIHILACTRDRAYRNQRFTRALRQRIDLLGTSVCYGCYAGAPQGPNDPLIDKHRGVATRYPSVLCDLLLLLPISSSCQVPGGLMQRADSIPLPQPPQPPAIERTSSLPRPPIQLNTTQVDQAPPNGHYTFAAIRAAVITDQHLALTAPLARPKRASHNCSTEPPVLGDPKAVGQWLTFDGGCREVAVVSSEGETHMLTRPTSSDTAHVVCFVGPSDDPTVPLDTMFTWSRQNGKTPTKGLSLWSGCFRVQAPPQKTPSGYSAIVPLSLPLEDLLVSAVLHHVLFITFLKVPTLEAGQSLSRFAQSSGARLHPQSNPSVAVRVQFPTAGAARATLKSFLAQISEHIPIQSWYPRVDIQYDNRARAAAWVVNVNIPAQHQYFFSYLHGDSLQSCLAALETVTPASTTDQRDDPECTGSALP